MTNKHPLTKIAVTVMLVLTANIASAQMTTGQTPRLMIPQYTNTELQSVGCDPNNWNMLVNQYLAKRGLERSQQAQQQVADQMTATPAARGTGTGPGAGGATCFESAINTINNTMRTVNQIIAIFTGGGPDWSAIGNAVLGQLTTAACNQINQYTGSIAYNAVSPLNQSLNGGIGAINNTGVNVGGLGTVNAGGMVLGSATGNAGLGLNGSNNGTLPYISSGQVNSTINGTATGGVNTSTTSWYSNLNPFRSNTTNTQGQAQQTPPRLP